MSSTSQTSDVFVEIAPFKSTSESKINIVVSFVSAKQPNFIKKATTKKTKGTRKTRSTTTTTTTTVVISSSRNGANL